MFRLEDEIPDDFWECEALLDTAFGPGRFALSAYRLREGVEPVESRTPPKTLAFRLEI